MTTPVYMTNEEVLKFLPHRDPFLFIDYIESVRTPEEEKVFQETGVFGPGRGPVLDKKGLNGCTAVAHYKVRNEMAVLAGHFPGNPIVPGVVQIEMMAQASCFTISRLMPSPFSLKLEVALLKVEEAKFRRPIRPGMDLIIKSVCRKLWNQNMTYDCVVLCGEETMAEAALLAMASY